MSPVRPALVLPDPAVPLVPAGPTHSAPRRRSQLLPELAHQSELDVPPALRPGRLRRAWRALVGGMPSFEMLALGGFLMLAASGAI